MIHSDKYTMYAVEAYYVQYLQGRNPRNSSKKIREKSPKNPRKWSKMVNNGQTGRKRCQMSCKYCFLPCSAIWECFGPFLTILKLFKNGHF